MFSVGKKVDSRTSYSSHLSGNYSLTQCLLSKYANLLPKFENFTPLYILAGKGTHTSLFFTVMRGDYDALLDWPFRQKVTIMIVDQVTNKEHLVDSFRPEPKSSSFRRPRNEMNISSGK